jgi:hypothetical protein
MECIQVEGVNGTAKKNVLGRDYVRQSKKCGESKNADM